MKNDCYLHYSEYQLGLAHARSHQVRNSPARCGVENVAYHAGYEDGLRETLKAGDLVTCGVEPPGFENTVYTYLCVDTIDHFVILREHANGVGYQGLSFAPDAVRPSDKFPRPFPDPGMNKKHVELLEHSMPDGAYVQHWDIEIDRRMCSVCPDTESSKLVRRSKSRRVPKEGYPVGTVFMHDHWEQKVMF